MDRHPQSPDIDLVTAQTRRAVARGNRAGAGVDQVVAADPGAMTLRQPFCQFDKTALGQMPDALFAATRRFLAFQATLVTQIAEDQLGMRFTDARLTLRRDVIVDFPDLVPDVPELARHAHAWAFMLPVVAIGGSLIRKLPEISPRAKEDGSADQFAGAKVAGPVAGYLEANRHVNHRPLAAGREQSVQA